MATIKVKQIRSRIHAPRNQKATLDTLGLRKMNQVVEVECRTFSIFFPHILGLGVYIT